jgi:hypothetical protein
MPLAPRKFQIPNFFADMQIGKEDEIDPVVISNSAIYGIIRRNARQVIEGGIAGDKELARRVADVRNAPARASARQALENHLSARKNSGVCKSFRRNVLGQNRQPREWRQFPIARPSIVYIRGEFVVWQFDSNQTAPATARPGALRTWTEGPAFRHAQP